MGDLVSIIVPVYNAEKTVVNCIRSILSQSYKNIELLVIDDASTDSSWQVLEGIEGSSKLKKRRLDRNQGVAVARNIGIKMSRGRYLAFCDSDDYWHKDKIEKQLLHMRITKTAVSFTSYWIVDSFGQTIGVRVAPKSVDYQNLLLTNGIGCSTALIDSNQTGVIEFPNYRKRQDWMLWLSLSKSIKKEFHSVQEPLAYYRKSSNSLSSNKTSLIKYNFQVYREFLGFSWIWSLISLFKFLGYYFIKRIKQ
jgi:teichuronic acid biosynthesis glycosyltransferase TuaG